MKKNNRKSSSREILPDSICLFRYDGMIKLYSRARLRTVAVLKRVAYTSAEAELFKWLVGYRYGYQCEKICLYANWCTT